MDRKQQAAAAILVACMVLCASSTSSGDAATAAGGGCALSTIVVTQSGTHEWAHGQPVYATTVHNACPCVQSDVKVACAGFDTTLAVDPAKLRQVAGGGVCLVNGGAGTERRLQVRLKQAVRVPAGVGHRDVLG